MLYTELLIVFVLALFNGVLAMSELAIVSSRRGRLEQLADKGSGGAHVALHLMEDPSRLLSTVQIGITMVGVISGAYSGATLGARLGAWLEGFAWLAEHGQTVGIGITVTGITYLSLIVGELVPKRVALIFPERIAALVAPPMQALAKAMSPVVWLLKVSTETVLKVLRLNRRTAAPVSSDDIKAMVARGAQAGVFEHEEKQMIEGVLRLSSRPVRVIMRPRSEIVWVDINKGPDAFYELGNASRYSRLVVCDGSIDHPIGVIHTKSLFADTLTDGPLSIRTLMTPLLFVPEGTPALRLLELFRSERVHIAVVTSEYGSTEGLVTLADVLASIAGDLPEIGDAHEPRVVKLSDGAWMVDGAFPIDEIQDRTGWDGLSDDQSVQKLAAFVLNKLARIPEIGSTFCHQGVCFEVAAMTGHRIDKVRMRLLSPEEAEAMEAEQRSSRETTVELLPGQPPKGD